MGEVQGAQPAQPVHYGATPVDQRIRNGATPLEFEVPETAVMASDGRAARNHPFADRRVSAHIAGQLQNSLCERRPRPGTARLKAAIKNNGGALSTTLTYRAERGRNGNISLVPVRTSNLPNGALTFDVREAAGAVSLTPAQASALQIRVGDTMPVQVTVNTNSAADTDYSFHVIGR